MLPDTLIQRATESLAKRGVEFITGTPVTGVDGNVISLKIVNQLLQIHLFGQVG